MTASSIMLENPTDLNRGVQHVLPNWYHDPLQPPHRSPTHPTAPPPRPPQQQQLPEAIHGPSTSSLPMPIAGPSASGVTKPIGPSPPKRRKTLPTQQHGPPPLNLNLEGVCLDPASSEVTFHRQPSANAGNAAPVDNAAASTSVDNAAAAVPINPKSNKPYLATKDFAKKKYPCVFSPTSSPMDVIPPPDTAPSELLCLGTTAHRPWMYHLLHHKHLQLRSWT